MDSVVTTHQKTHMNTKPPPIPVANKTTDHMKTTYYALKTSRENAWLLGSISTIRPLSEIWGSLQSTRGFLRLLGVHFEHLEKINTTWAAQDNVVSLSTNEDYVGFISDNQLLRVFHQGLQNPNRITTQHRISRGLFDSVAFTWIKHKTRFSENYHHTLRITSVRSVSRLVSYAKQEDDRNIRHTVGQERYWSTF